MYAMLSQEMIASAIQLICVISTAFVAIVGYLMSLRV
jgi:hypothetical protein